MEEEVVFQYLMVLSCDPETNVLQSMDTNADTTSSCPVNVCKHCPLPTEYNLIVRSRLPLTNRSVSSTMGDNALTNEVCPVNVRIQFSLSIFHSLIVRSSDPDMKCLLSNTDMAWTQSVCPRNVRIHSPVLAFHNRTVVSHEDEMKWFVSIDAICVIGDV